MISNLANETDQQPDSIWLIWDVRLWEIENTIIHEQFIHCTAKNKGGLKLHATFVYASTNYKEREKLWEEIINISRMIQGPWIILGDFNQVRNMVDRIGVHTRVSLPNMRAFNQSINMAYLKEIEIKANPVTWTNRRIEEHRISSKIDKGFGNMDLFNLWPDRY